MKTLFEGKKLYAVIIAFLLIITFFITFYIIRNHYQYVFKNVITENTLTANFLSTLMYEHQKSAIGILESYAQRPLFLATFIKENTIDPKKSITLLDQGGNIIFSNAVPYQEKITKYPDAHVLEKALAGNTVRHGYCRLL